MSVDRFGLLFFRTRLWAAFHSVSRENAAPAATVSAGRVSCPTKLGGRNKSVRISMDYARKNIDEAVCSCWCSASKKRFGIVLVSRTPNCWIVMHAYSTSESYCEPEANRTINGNLEIASSYRGCKSCGNDGLFLCVACDSLNCAASVSEGNVACCAKCGASGLIGGPITELRTSSD